MMPRFFGIRRYAGRLKSVTWPVGPSHAGLSMFTEELIDDMI